MIDIYYVKNYINFMNVIKKANLAFTGETLATEFLAKSGYAILGRNFHSAYGEIDIIAMDKVEVVFVEVKTRTGQSVKSAENSVTHSKQRKLSLTALKFLADNPRYSNKSCRFDVIIVLHNPYEDSYAVKHYKNAFLPLIPDNQSY